VQLGLGYAAVPLAGRGGRGKSTCCVYTAAEKNAHFDSFPAFTYLREDESARAPRFPPPNNFFAFF